MILRKQGQSSLKMEQGQCGLLKYKQGQFSPLPNIISSTFTILVTEHLPSSLEAIPGRHSVRYDIVL
jgi:hypothetical protein